MIELGRFVREALRRLLPEVNAGTAVVRVPTAAPPEVGEQLVGRLDQLLSARASGLRLPGWGAVGQREPDTDRVTVLLRGRPIAVVSQEFAPADPEGWVDAVTKEVDTALRRRLSVLADVPALLRVRGFSEPTATQVGAVGLLLDCGISAHRVNAEQLVELAQQVPDSAAELGESLIDTLAPDGIELELAEATMRAVTDRRPDDVVRMREELYAETGLQFPDIRLRVLDRRPPGTIRIRLHDVVLERSLGPSADWAAAVTALHRLLRENAWWFVRTQELRAALDQLAGVQPQLVRLALAGYAVSQLAGCLRELLRHGDSYRNLPRLLWLLLQVTNEAEPGRARIADPILFAGQASAHGVSASTTELAATVRRLDADEQFGRDPLEAGPELVVPKAIQRTLADANDAADVAAAERELLELVLAASAADRVLVDRARSVPAVRAALQALPTPPRVVCAQELPLGAG